MVPGGGRKNRGPRDRTEGTVPVSLSETDISLDRLKVREWWAHKDSNLGPAD
jgi:hypothetical protein